MKAGWRQYLVRVQNEAGVTAKLRVKSPEGQAAYVAGSPKVEPNAKPRGSRPARTQCPLAGHADV